MSQVFISYSRAPLNVRSPWSGLFLMVLVVGLLLSAQSSQPNRRVELPHGFTAASITAKAPPSSRETLHAHLAAQGGSSLFPCPLGDTPGFECFLFNWGPVDVRPYPVLLPGTQAKIPGTGNTVVYQWVHADQVHDAARLLDSWRKAAASGVPTSCSGAACSLLVEAIVPGQAANEISYAACKVIQINGRFGAPQDCHQMAIQLGEKAWLYAVTGSNYSAPSLGRPAFSLSLRAGPPYYVPPSKASLSKALADGLRSPPLNYEVQNWPDSVQAIASYRVSPLLLNNWRETVTITITLRD